MGAGFETGSGLLRHLDQPGDRRARFSFRGFGGVGDRVGRPEARPIFPIRARVPHMKEAKAAIAAFDDLHAVLPVWTGDRFDDPAHLGGLVLRLAHRQLQVRRQISVALR